MKTLLYSLLALAVLVIAVGVAGGLLAVDSVRPLAPYKGLAGGVDVRLNAGPYDEVSYGPSESGEWTLDKVIR